MSLISVRNVRKHYRLERAQAPALIDVNLDIEAGERVCLMGPSGSGKSTLLKLIGCIDTPTAGTVIVSENVEYGVSCMGAPRARRVHMDQRRPALRHGGVLL